MPTLEDKVRAAVLASLEKNTVAERAIAHWGEHLIVTQTIDGMTTSELLTLISNALDPE